jgi:hypothetical protein
MDAPSDSEATQSRHEPLWFPDRRPQKGSSWLFIKIASVLLLVWCFWDVMGLPFAWSQYQSHECLRALTIEQRASKILAENPLIGRSYQPVP